MLAAGVAAVGNLPGAAVIYGPAKEYVGNLKMQRMQADLSNLNDQVYYLLEAKNTPEPIMKEWLAEIGLDPDQAIVSLRALLTLGLEARAGQAPASFLEEDDWARLPTTSSKLFGRQEELELLDLCWADPGVHVLSLVAAGGVGKSALVNKWMHLMEEEQYRGAARVFGWSFYSQGFKEDRHVSADDFLEETLKWFGYTGPELKSAWDKGRELAKLVCAKRTLLVLDGLEPLQYPPGEMEGCLKDQGLQALLKGLARSHHAGLCVITTRHKVTDLDDAADHSLVRRSLGRLEPADGAALLDSLGVGNATQGELEQACDEYGGHALALTLLGNYLAKVHGGEIRKRGDIPALAGLKDKQGYHARKVMAAYENWLAGTPELDVLYLMGLFDRPAAASALDALRRPPAMTGVTERLQGLVGDGWSLAVHNLRRQGLLAPDDQKKPGVLDCHPLVREHFADRLEEGSPEAWKAAHLRLYGYYREQAPHQPDTLEEMEPLFAAVRHGCQAGKHQDAMDEVYWERIRRGKESYCAFQLGAMGSELACLASFFEHAWDRPASGLAEADQSFVLSEAGYDLRALGRLAEAGRPMAAVLGYEVKMKHWKNAGISAGNLSGLHLALGQVEKAVEYAAQAVKHADQSGDDFQKLARRTDLANAQHQAGKLDKARGLFKEAEAMQAKDDPQFHYLYSLRGFQFCDLLLSAGAYGEVLERAGQTLEWAQKHELPLLTRALDRLSLGRAHLLKARDGGGGLTKAEGWLNQAVAGLYNAEQQDYLPCGLLAWAELWREKRDWAHAEEDLEEVREICERGQMDLYLADYHLEAGRLCVARNQAKPDPELLRQARTHQQEAARRVEKMGYHRRDGEVAGLDEALKARGG